MVDTLELAVTVAACIAVLLVTLLLYAVKKLRILHKYLYKVSKEILMIDITKQSCDPSFSRGFYCVGIVFR